MAHLIGLTQGSWTLIDITDTHEGSRALWRNQDTGRIVSIKLED